MPQDRLTSLAITELGRSHLDGAAALLARRHADVRSCEPTLGEQLTEPAEARRVIEPLLQRPDSIGVVATVGDDVVGYLCGWVEGGELRVPVAGNAVGGEARVAGALYAELARRAVDRGARSHQIVVPCDPSGRELDAWYGLSFGREQAYAVRPVTPVPPKPARPDLTIRLGTLDDLDAVLPLGGLVAELQNRSPVFASIGDDFFAQLRDAHAEELTNPASSYYVADRGDRIEGLAIIADAAPGLTVPPSALELAFQVTRADVQGRGVGTALFQRICRDAAEAGRRVIVADWRTTNQSSSVFWPARGFRPIAYRLRRVIAP